LRKIIKNIFIPKISFMIVFFIPQFINAQNQPKFIKNLGQFHQNIHFKLEHSAGNIYFERSGVRFDLFQKEKINAIKHGNTSLEKVLGHRYKNLFINANSEVEIIGEKKNYSYHNYFIGDNPEKWKSNVPIFNSVRYNNLYDHIDLNYYSSGGKLKYDFIIHPNAKIKSLKIQYNGLDSIYLKSGHLILKTSLGNIIEQAPIAYQLINGLKKIVDCKFVLKENILSFNIDEKYNKAIDLIIDPLLIFSTYSGSGANNWGETATYDNQGHLYAGSIAFGNGYDVTTGAYDMFFNGGIGTGGNGTDICISKFSPNGDSIKYSTYLGGSGNENPHSLVVNDNYELFILGSTGSSDYPTTNNAYDTSFNNGDFFGFINYPANSSSYYLEYPTGTDIVVTKLSADGSNLLGSTFIGGSKNDGINESGANNINGNKLCYFYADEYRGEITLDSLGNCYVASSSSSIDFPLLNPSQITIGGQQDAVAFKLNSNLTSLMWSTYIGGSDDDAGYSVQLNNQEQALICGGTISNDLFTNNSSVNQNYSGNVDGFVQKHNTINGNILASSYIGDSGFNQCYFVQVDIDNNVYLYGLTNSTYNIYPTSVYNSVGSQFIHKLDSNLSTTLVSTSFGNGNLSRNITPSAFLVSDCGLIYISGWGGLNANNGNINNMPIVNPTQATTSSGDFYLAVFLPDMESMIYGSYFGGSSSNEHVDGGTSRFDKNGKIYQAVCAGCQGNNDFPTSPNVYSSVNGSSGCNLGAFKLDLESIYATISLPSYFSCLPNSCYFDNLSQGGNQYYWNFGDGNTSNLVSPYHTYSDTGSYNVTLIVSDSAGCIMPDTSNVLVNIYEINNALVVGDSILCPGTVSTLNAYGGTQFSWTPTNSLSSGNGQQVIATPNTNTTYMLVAVDSCSIDTAYFDVIIPNDIYQTSNDTIICKEDSLIINASGGIVYRWSGLNIINVDSANPIVNPLQNSVYYVDITTPNGCVYTDSVLIEVDLSIPNIILQDTLNLCMGDSGLVTLPNLDNATWSPVGLPSDTTGNNIWIKSDSNATYYIVSQNSCGQSLDSITALVFGYSGSAFGDTAICFGDTAEIYAADGINYFWYPNNGLSNNDSSWTYAYPSQSTDYKVIVENNYGCRDTFEVGVYVSETPIVSAGINFWMSYGESINLNGFTNASSYYWESTSWISCPTCLNPQINATETTLYILNVTDSIGCLNSDSVEVSIKGDIFVPNTFTPNGDGDNDLFEIRGENIESYELWIYNRWGEEIYNTTEITDFWDGSFEGEKCKIDSYIWVIEYFDYNQNFNFLNGHINLIE
jgi:gliding motility-associated-like protein